MADAGDEPDKTNRVRKQIPPQVGGHGSRVARERPARAPRGAQGTARYWRTSDEALRP